MAQKQTSLTHTHTHTHTRTHTHTHMWLKTQTYRTRLPSSPSLPIGEVPRSPLMASLAFMEYVGLGFARRTACSCLVGQLRGTRFLAVCKLANKSLLVRCSCSLCKASLSTKLKCTEESVEWHVALVSKTNETVQAQWLLPVSEFVLYQTHIGRLAHR